MNLRTLFIAIALTLFALLSLTSTAPAASIGIDDHDSDARDGRSFVIRAGQVMPVAVNGPDVIEDAVIIVRDGIIESVGEASKTNIPTNLPTLNLPDATVIPGIVAAQSNLTPQHQDDHSISGAFQAADAFNRYADFRNTVKSGITTAHLNPGWHRLVAGRGSIAKLGDHHNSRIIEPVADLTINFGPAAFNPPNLVEILMPPSGDQPIEPATPQRPSSRVDQYLALTEAVATSADDFDIHLQTFQNAWNSDTPLRVQTQHEEDLAGAIAFINQHNRAAYIVGGIEAVTVADELRESELPLVYTINSSLRSTNANIGPDADALEGDVADLAKLRGIKLALALPNNQPVADLRLIAATAQRAGWSEQDVLAAITRVPAEILGIADTVGSLEAGKSADMVILNGPPLAATSHIERVFINGGLAYKIEDAFAHASKRSSTGKSSSALSTARPLVVQAGTIWLGPNEVLKDGQVLIEYGRITAVGKSIPHPPGARVIDAGDDAFVTPGFIDGFGHLGLQGDRTALSPELSLARTIGMPDVTANRVARHGVTTVILSPYRFNANGSQMSAVKTAGNGRDARVIKPSAAVGFSVRGADPQTIPARLNQRIAAGQKYLDKWKKYEADLAEWKKKKAEGKLEELKAKPKTEEAPEEETKEDPITGTWNARIFGGPLPEEFTGDVALRLTGDKVEGRITNPVPPVEIRIVGTLAGNKLTGTLQVDEESPMGDPEFDLTLTPDLLKGTIGVQQFSANVEAKRTSKEAVEFSVSRGRRLTRGKDGEPLPPPVDEALEPIRMALEKHIPIVVEASTVQEIDAVLDTLVDKHELNVILLNGDAASTHLARLTEKDVGVIVPTNLVSTRDDQPYVAADDLARSGVHVAFQSNAEDGARMLPMVGLRAVSYGLSPEDALAAMTIDAAKMYQVDDRVGIIKQGRDGDLVIFSGHPFDASSAVLRVIVNGQEVPTHAN